MITASSFDGLNGAVWGYDLGPAHHDGLADGIEPLMRRWRHGGAEIPGTPGTTPARCGRTAPWRTQRPGLARAVGYGARACTACRGGLEKLTAARDDYGLIKRVGERGCRQRRQRAQARRCDVVTMQKD
jgi:hypothetical protein